MLDRLMGTMEIEIPEARVIGNSGKLDAQRSRARRCSTAVERAIAEFRWLDRACYGHAELWPCQTMAMPKQDPNTPYNRPDNTPPPDWMTEGAAVWHDHFGVGRIGRVGLLKRTHTVWVDFDSAGVRALAPHYATPRMRLLKPPG